MLSSLPPGSAGFDKVAVRGGGGAAHSRSTSAGSSLSDGRSSNDQKTVLRPACPSKSPMEDSLFAIDMFGPCKYEYPTPSPPPGLTDTNASRALSLEEYHEERESIRSLKEYYEDRQKQSCAVSGIGLPPGLTDLVQLRQDPSELAAVEATLRCTAEVVEASDIAQAELFHAAFRFETPQLGSSAMQQPFEDSPDVIGQAFNVSGHSFDVNAQPFEVSAKPFDVSAKPFEPSGLSGQAFDVGAQPFEPSGQSFDVSGQAFDVSAQAFNVTGQPFDVSGQSCDASGQPFDANGLSYDASAQPFDVSGQTFDVSGQPFDITVHQFDGSEQSFDVSAQAFDVNGHAFNVSGQPYHVQSCDVSGQTFDVSGHEFDMNGQSFDVSGQPFDFETPWLSTTFQESTLLGSFEDMHSSQATQPPLLFDEQFATSDLFSPPGTWEPQTSPPAILSTQPAHVPSRAMACMAY